VRQAREAAGHGRGRRRLAAREWLAHVGLDSYERHLERFDAGVAEPDEPVSEIKSVCLLGLLAVVITPEERSAELTGELGMLKRLLAARDLQEALGDRAASERRSICFIPMSSYMAAETGAGACFDLSLHNIHYRALTGSASV
jgi:hypothetical protein